MKRRLLFAGAGLAVVVAAGSTTAALAADGSASPAPSQQTGVRCATVAKRQARVDKVTARLNADAATKGSIKWLQAKQAQAKNPQVAAIIGDRVRIRQSQLTTLGIRKDMLTKIAALCAAKG